MKRTLIFLAIASFLVGGAIYAGSKTTPLQTSKTNDPRSDQKPTQAKIDIAIALDTSGSMSGLINSARQKLWDIVNEVSKAKPTPRLRVALLTYGSEGTEADGYVRVRSNLTTDLDSIYAKLFELRTSGGTEYVGRVVYRSLKELDWDRDPDTLRQIYVAGNESANQDRRVPVGTALELAKKHDVFVNAIFCGGERDQDANSWRAVATTGRGMYASIDHNHGTLAIRTPYDAEMQRLGQQLNGTYVGYGRQGAAAAAVQSAQDKNAASMGAAGASRALAKASRVYRNDRWDLVDARKAGKKVAKAELPAKLRGMSADELRTHLDKKEAERKGLQAKIRELAKKRQQHISAEMKKQGKTESHAFEGAVKRALRKQAAAKRMRF